MDGLVKQFQVRIIIGPLFLRLERLTPPLLDLLQFGTGEHKFPGIQIGREDGLLQQPFSTLPVLALRLNESNHIIEPTLFGFGVPGLQGGVLSNDSVQDLDQVAMEFGG